MESILSEFRMRGFQYKNCFLSVFAAPISSWGSIGGLSGGDLCRKERELDLRTSDSTGQGIIEGHEVAPESDEILAEERTANEWFGFRRMPFSAGLSSTAG